MAQQNASWSSHHKTARNHFVTVHSRVKIFQEVFTERKYTPWIELLHREVQGSFEWCSAHSAQVKWSANITHTHTVLNWFVPGFPSLLWRVIFPSFLRPRQFLSHSYSLAEITSNINMSDICIFQIPVPNSWLPQMPGKNAILSLCFLNQCQLLRFLGSHCLASVVIRLLQLYSWSSTNSNSNSLLFFSTC